MSSLQEYFHTEWGAMTLHDWIGLIITVAVFILMIFVYVYVFHPKNRNKLESQRHLPLDDDDRVDTEERNDR